VLVGVGNPLLDMTVQGKPELLDKYGLKPNDAIIAEAKHEKLFAEMMTDYTPTYMAGGATQNSIRVAQWLLQRPNATIFFGCVGEDEAATILWQKARDAGVNVRYQVDGLRATGMCGSIITGHNRSLVARLGAADFLTHMWIESPGNWHYIQNAQCFYIGGFVFPVCSQIMFDIAAHAADTNKCMCLNLSAPFLCKYSADKSWDIMPLIDVLFGNETEAALFCHLRGIQGDSLEDLALKVAALPKANNLRPRTVVFTQGRAPTIVAQGTKVFQHKFENVDKALIKDTNGCGDAFVGGFLSQLVQKKSLEDCLNVGSYAAHVVIQHWGCSYPDTPPSL
jgi:adenosine kinase